MTAGSPGILAAVRDALSAHRPADMPALPGRTNHIACGVLVPLESPHGITTERDEYVPITLRVMQLVTRSVTATLGFCRCFGGTSLR